MCQECKLSKTADEVCQVGFGPTKAKIVVVSRMPNSRAYQETLETELEQAGVDLSSVYWSSALKCRTFDQDASNSDVKKCRHYLIDEIDLVKAKWVLALGNEALLSAAGNSGITKHRGSVIDKGTYKVVPTLSLAAVNRQPGLLSSWRADLRYFANQVADLGAELDVPKIAVVDTAAKLKLLCSLLDRAEVLSYDIETRGELYTDEGVIVSLAGYCSHMVGGVEKLTCWALPLAHPESPFRKSWRRVLAKLAPHLERVPKQVAHNGKFDAKWLRHHGVQAKVTFDTLIGAHLLDENRQKGLKPLARIIFGADAWAISTSDLWTTPLPTVLKYNALDTFYTYHLYLVFKRQLSVRPRLARIFKLLLMPANESYIEAERRGIWVDRTRLAEATKISFDMRDQIDRELMGYVPSPTSPGSSMHAESNAPWPTDARDRPVKVNFNASNFARWWLFDHLGLPVIERGKPKDDGSPGAPSLREACMLELKGQHPVVDLLLDRAWWQKCCSNYVLRYEELLDGDDRIHTTFKLFGTVTGRTSSGKEDAEKLTARTKQRGVNLQQVPRDPLIRGVFGAAPGYTFVEADFSQVELRLIAFVSRDPTMLGIYQRGEDIHQATASWVMGIPFSQVTKDDRKKAKAVNFGFVYGMGAPKFVSTAFEKYELVFSIDEARAIRRQFFERFSGLPAWHSKQRRLVNKHARVNSPLGRVRHLPDIRSNDPKVQGEAERQAINSPIQAMGSDMALLSMVEIERKAREHPDPDAIRVLGTVHDSINFEVKTEHMCWALPLIKITMENLPLRKKFGVDLDVPIIADVKAGTHWADARELTEGEIFAWKK